MSVKSGNLFLATSQISTPASTANVGNVVGGWTTGRQTFYFNVNMRQLLGDLWDTHDTFALRLNSISAFPEASMTNAINARINIGGLNWRNSSYRQETKSNNYYAPLCFIQLNATTLVEKIFPSDTMPLVFTKGDAEPRIEFEVRNGLTNALAVPTANYLPTFFMSFDIFPVEKEDK